MIKGFIEVTNIKTDTMYDLHMKPEYILHNNDIKKVGYFICSKCGRKLTKRPLPNFCPNCGQALDWSDEK